MLIRCALNNIVGGDDYTIYATLKENGKQVENVIQPVNSYYIASNTQGIVFPSIMLPLNQGDTIKIYVKVLFSDKSVAINTSWFDLSIASASAVGNIPTNTLLADDPRIPDMIASASSVGNITGTSASTIWQYETRELTTATPSTSASEIWNYFERTITSASGLGLASASSVGNITGTSASSIWEYGNRTLTSASSILDVVIEGKFTFQQIIQIMASVLAGKMTGSNTGTLTFRDLSDTIDRIAVDVNGLAERTGLS